MRKMILTVTVLAMVGLAFAAAKSKNTSTGLQSHECISESVKQSRDDYMRVFGGDILRPNSRKGSIAIINAQSKVPRDELEKPIKAISDNFAYAISVTNINVQISSFEDIRKARKDSGATLAVVVCNNTDMPALFAAPEECWSAVNVGCLGDACTKPVYLAARTRKEIIRSLSLVCGGWCSRFPESLLSAIKSADELDEFPDRKIPFDVIQRFQPYLEKLGVTPAEYASYLDAIEEGWAPAPTNEYQKAIWEKVHAVPANPMKIEFDPKKGR